MVLAFARCGRSRSIRSYAVRFWRRHLRRPVQLLLAPHLSDTATLQKFRRGKSRLFYETVWKEIDASKPRPHPQPHTTFADSYVTAVRNQWKTYTRPRPLTINSNYIQNCNAKLFLIQCIAMASLDNIRNHFESDCLYVNQTVEWTRFASSSRFCLLTP